MSDPEIHRIGHAGLDGGYPPNTIAGIRAAASSMDTIEVDVRRCRSGEVVLFHDADLEPVTGHEGGMSETDWETVRTLTIHDSGEHVPTLGDAIRAVPPSVGFNLELKELGLASPVERIVAGTGTPVLVSSFRPAVLAGVRTCDWRVDTALLFEDDPGRNVERALDLDCTHVHPHVDCCLETDVVDRAHRAGLSVNAWTVRDAETARALVDERVDGLILDRTGLV